MGGDPRDRADVDARAPVKGAAEIEIAAPRQGVWDVLTAFEEWPTWNPDVKSVSVEGEVAEGSEFRWKAGPGTITSRIRRLDEPGRIAWTGTTFGIKAIHVYTLEPRDTKTLVRSEESYHGLVSRLFRRSLQKTLDKALVSGLQHLKAEAERRVPVAPSSD